jgi:hypothetical protein
VFFVPYLAKLRTRNEPWNILVLECLGIIESNRVVIVTHGPIAKLEFGLGIMP